MPIMHRFTDAEHERDSLDRRTYRGPERIAALGIMSLKYGCAFEQQSGTKNRKNFNHNKINEKKNVNKKKKFKKTLTGITTAT